MKTLKILLALAFSIFLLANVSAIPSVYGQWEGVTASATITNGQSIGFDVYYASSTPPMTISATLYDSANPSTPLSTGVLIASQSVSQTYWFTAQPIQVTPSNYLNAGNYFLKLTATDSQGTSTNSLILTVNPSAPVNNAPLITSTPVTSVNENASYTYDVDATDADGDTLTYSFIHYPNWLSINSATGIITGTAPSVASNTDYEVTVEVSDGQTTAEQTYNLRVNNIAGNSPVITVLGNNPQTIEVFSAYTELGATASDAEDGNLTSSITINQNVNTAVLGAYIVTYSVTDSDNNTATSARIVNVVDTTSPVITLNGANPMSITVGTNYIDAGATAADNYDAVLMILIDLSNVNTSVLGSFTVNYTTTDSSGNTATATRTVNVVSSIDTTPPVISIITPLNSQTYESVSALRFVVTDANPIACTYSVLGGVQNASVPCTSGNTVNVSLNASSGSNTWTVRATDSFGNTAVSTITFTVNPDSNKDKKDNTAPSGKVVLGDEVEASKFMEQFQPKAIRLQEPEKQVSVIERIINAIINFFKRLFNIK